MKRHESKFDRRLQKQFESFRPDVSSGIWEKISAELDARDEDIVPARSARMRYRTWLMGAAAVLILGMFALWLYQPTDPIYLQGPTVLVANTETTEQHVVEEQSAVVEVIKEPLNLAPIRALFAEKGRLKLANVDAGIHDGALASHDKGAVAQVDVERFILQEELDEAYSLPEEVIELPLVANEVKKPLDNSLLPEVYGYVLGPEGIESVPEVDMERQEGNAFGVSNILNLVVGSVDQRDEKLVTFSHDDEGLIKIDFNRALARTKRKN